MTIPNPTARTVTPRGHIMQQTPYVSCAKCGSGQLMALGADLRTKQSLLDNYAGDCITWAEKRERALRLRKERRADLEAEIEALPAKFEAMDKRMDDLAQQFPDGTVYR